MTRDDAMKRKHRDRAKEAIASHRCSTDLTDGFCGPRDGKCRQTGPHRNCIREAEGILRALETRGVVVVWIYDKAIAGDVDLEAERKA